MKQRTAPLTVKWLHGFTYWWRSTSKWRKLQTPASSSLYWNRTRYLCINKQTTRGL